EMHTSVNRGQMPGVVDDTKKKGAHLHVRPNGSKLPLLLLETMSQYSLALSAKQRHQPAYY
ncbi:MAG: hypothetical protein ACO37Z_02445, partial [Burkholderiaceae bacterium]